VNHVALVAFELGQPEEGHGVAVARFVRDRAAPMTAELAVTVIDHAQGRGVARRLLADLGELAQLRGIEMFTMSVLAGNARARRLLASLGAVPVGTSAGVMTFHLRVNALALAA
jgi:predicted GNAT superfamily acetyltransferase